MANVKTRVLQADSVSSERVPRIEHPGLIAIGSNGHALTQRKFLLVSVPRCEAALYQCVYISEFSTFIFIIQTSFWCCDEL